MSRVLMVEKESVAAKIGFLTNAGSLSFALAAILMMMLIFVISASSAAIALCSMVFAIGVACVPKTVIDSENVEVSMHKSFVHVHEYEDDSEDQEGSTTPEMVMSAGGEAIPFGSTDSEGFVGSFGDTRIY